MIFARRDVSKSEVVESSKRDLELCRVCCFEIYMYTTMYRVFGLDFFYLSIVCIVKSNTVCHVVESDPISDTTTRLYRMSQRQEHFVAKFKFWFNISKCFRQFLGRFVRILNISIIGLFSFITKFSALNTVTIFFARRSQGDSLDS